MKVCEYNGFEIHIPTTGGKAGKGHNVTSTIQLRRGGMIEKQIRFTVSDADSRRRAYDKAKRYADKNKD